MTRRVLAAALIGVLAGAVSASGAWAQAALRNERFDDGIRRAAKMYLPGVDWRLWKAQLVAESGLNPKARSGVGAEGIAQFMPATWAHVLPQIGLDPKLVPRTEASVAIEAGAFYMATLLRQWMGWTDVRGVNAYEHSIAGYNAGPGNILKAWRFCERPAPWDATARCLPRVTGRHADETRGYVVRIRGYHRAMQAF